jgi:endonuclease YncB( thermonuclease family)
MTPDYKYRAHYVSNYDGDTIRFDIDLGFGILAKKQIFRLLGVNCPEIQGENAMKGKLARDYVETVLSTAAEIIVQSERDRKEKYGRWLATVYYREAGSELFTLLNQELVLKGMAVVAIY